MEERKQFSEIVGTSTCMHVSTQRTCVCIMARWPRIYLFAIREGGMLMAIFFQCEIIA